MRRGTALRTAAVLLYGAYWGLSVFGYMPFDRGDLSEVPNTAFYALAIGAPCIACGAAIGRWWAPAVGLWFVAFVPLPDHCVTSRPESDVLAIACSGIDGPDLPLLLAVTTPCVLAGVGAVKAVRRLATLRAAPGA